ncbi:hypothetical protein L596_008302 [Steinernema carpocapsae]|uniref:Uncharacterized protein n=1 Tax=Steinernema carpocapsae TaxID=34508 RepID=A0A4U5PC60_STECR|nr:hypothetical protein L596_008302 [Steinernema carpocapsae]
MPLLTRLQTFSNVINGEEPGTKSHEQKSEERRTVGEVLSEIIRAASGCDEVCESGKVKPAEGYGRMMNLGKLSGGSQRLHNTRIPSLAKSMTHLSLHDFPLPLPGSLSLCCSHFVTIGGIIFV